ncbi:MAG: hypothetical protein H2041_11030 [Phenylobacterium sp.]|uniref:hypothetical protein n=1 Tax=Phenylobacterium sp. TaxID=1871053 RepID=UPI001847925C|nr:hypothetical protein [Phenylobacterium sp.]MBA4794188.1 hypothetical protein [Phenylobacterium sp.]
MGVRLDWLAVRAGRRKALLDRLDLELAGEVSQEVGEGLVLATLPSGWLVLVGPHDDPAILPNIGPASEACGEGLGGQVVESVGYSRLQRYEAGRMLWSLASGASTGISERSGAPPPLPEDCATPFEAVLALSESLCGYRPGETSGLAWRRLVRRGAARPANGGGALLQRMRIELIPLLEDLGWSAPPVPKMADAGVITRELGDHRQTIWFEYASGRETYIRVHFESADAQDGDSRGELGFVGAPRKEPLPVWKRFTWKRLAELSNYPPGPADPITAALDRAREEIQVADAYLRTGAPDRRIYVTQRWPQA